MVLKIDYNTVKLKKVA